jgi:carbamate kinase
LKRTAVIAIGGNSLILPGQAGTVEEQRENVRQTCESVADVLAAGYHVVITHGNGPQVGAALLKSEIALREVPPATLDVCDAETQATIGYMIQQVLRGVLEARGMPRPVATMITQVVVDPKDPAFQNPTKPIGPFLKRKEADLRRQDRGWSIVEDAGRGWRRVVASPQPLEIVELDAIRRCLINGVAVIAVGGGGIPVVREEGGLHGVEAVIDKDRASGLLAGHLRADLLLISTSIDRLAIHFGKPNQQFLSEMMLEDARRYLAEGHFPPGSMGPKVEAAIFYLERGGKHVIITSPEKMGLALEGKAGTSIRPTPKGARSIPKAEPIAKPRALG